MLSNHEVSLEASPVLSELYLENKECLPLVIQFLKSLPEKIELLQKYIHENNLIELKVLSHKLAGSAGLYGYPEFHKVLKALEKLSESGDLSKSDILLVKIKSKFKTIMSGYEIMQSEIA